MKDAADFYRNQIVKGLECQVNEFRMYLEGNRNPREGSEQGKDLIRYSFWGAHAGSQKVEAEARVQPSTH